MNRVAVISTYPERGSQNIGDRLIERSVVDILREYNPYAAITTHWRAEKWDAIRDEIEGADLVVFACLAIRHNMAAVYPYMSNIIETHVPVAVLSSGTDLDPIGADDMFSVEADDLSLLRKVASAAKVFTSRGVITQRFLDVNGVGPARMSGDIAFTSQKADSAPLVSGNPIIISDPHYAAHYEKAFKTLATGLASMFPRTPIVLALHGKNRRAEEWAKEMGIKSERLYERGDEALQVYGRAKLHVGFRVHGHVSALARGVPSYLFEQDGRGADYGRTIPIVTSVPLYAHHLSRAMRNKSTARRIVGSARRRLQRSAMAEQVPNGPVQQMLALISADSQRGFERFDAVSPWIDNVRAGCRRAVKLSTTRSGAGASAE